MEDGANFLLGLNDVVLKNIEAILYLKEIICTSYGPEGMNKLISKDSEKILVTSDTVTILKNLDFFHPAGKLLIFSALTQEQNLGDSAGFVVIFASELLKKSYELIKEGFRVSEIVKNFEKAGKISLKFLETLAFFKLADITNVKIVGSLLSLTIGSESQNLKNYLVPQIAYACIKTLSFDKKKFSPDNIRVIKILGGTLNQIKTVAGTIVLRDSEGTIKISKKGNVVIFSNNFDISNPETKSSILFKSAEDIMSYEFTENLVIEQLVKELVECGINVIISSGFSDISLYFIEKFNIMAIKIQSKFDLRRIAKTCNAIVIGTIRKPGLEEIGKCDLISVRSFGSQKVTIFQQNVSRSKIFTIVARASSTNILNSIEKTVYRLTSVFKTMTRDNRFVPGGGACEIEMCKRLKSFSTDKHSGFKQHIIQKFAESFESIPKTLIENSGYNPHKILSSLHLYHSKGYLTEGVNIHEPFTVDIKKTGIWDLFACKYWGIKHAIEISSTILTVDQIIMAKRNLKNMDN